MVFIQTIKDDELSQTVLGYSNESVQYAIIVNSGKVFGSRYKLGMSYFL